MPQSPQTPIPCTLMRGGTSKGPFFLADDLPSDVQLRDRVLLAVMGSPDARQIDGIGGADPLTSKVAIISRSSRTGIDVDYLFAQVSIDQPFVDVTPNCGNMLAGVGPFSIERGLITSRDPVTPVKIYMVNTGNIAVAHVPTPDGEITCEGGTSICGGTRHIRCNSRRLPQYGRFGLWRVVADRTLHRRNRRHRGNANR